MKVTWEQIQSLCNWHLIKAPDIIIGIARGGLIPATILSYRFGAPLYLLNCQSFGSDGTRGKVQARISEELKQVLGRPQKVLLVDDIADTGQTLFAAHQLIGTCESFSLVYKPTSSYKPTYPGILFDSEDWVDFPWDPAP